MKSAIANTLLVVVLSAVCLLLLEGMTRLVLDDGMLYELEMWRYARDVKVRDYRPDLGHRHRPNADARLMGVDVRTDSRGFRSTEIPATAPGGVARIAFVGDSTTLGWGAAQNETFAHRVIETLQKGGRKVDGFNLGVGNYNTRQELTLFRDVGVGMKPDIVVLTYFINDAEPMPRYGKTNWLDEHSAAWVVANYRVDSLMRQMGEAPDWKRYYRELYDDKAPGWTATRRALLGFADTSREIGAQLVVFNLPELRELKPYPFSDVTAKVAADVKALGVPFIDLLPAFENLQPSTLWVTVPDPHPNGRAMDVAAKAMLPEITSVLDRLCREKQKGC
jgi:lysophospholipase L1-like esterase